MLLVIFGAGASYDSMPSHPANLRGPFIVEQNRPPLANQLFEDRGHFAAALSEFPECHEIIPWLRKPQETTLEGELQRLQDQAQSYPARHSQLAAVRHYLQQMLWRCEQGWKQSAMGITNFKSLLDMVEQWRHSRNESVCLVTFNYDTLLEDALPVVGLRTTAIADYISAHPQYIVVKLHGSVNWAREIESPVEFQTPQGDPKIVHEIIRRASELEVSNRYVQGEPYVTGFHDGTAVFPAIAIPVERKSQFECPPEHLQALRSRLPNVTKVIVVGWRAKEDSFLELLSEELRAPLQIMVVEGTDEGAKAVESQLSRVLGSRVPDGIQSISTGFTDFILRRRAIQFLEAEPTKISPLPSLG